MNFFTGNSTQPTGPSPLFAAKTDLEMYTDMFNRMSSVCAKKCITKFSDSDLQVGEMTCIDRCTGKYMHAQGMVGDILQAFESQQQAQQQAAAQFAPK
mmetsp:Transcript_10487/g.15984  ORF Transcript_10487/g.15984 Transcript_10487/m.15984 type:complete len:98 (+) Transcript_10487:91-384(+)